MLLELPFVFILLISQNSAIELNTVNITQGILYAEQSYDWLILVPITSYDSVNHVSPENPYVVRHELADAWEYIEKQLIEVKNSIVAGKPINPLSIDFVFKLNKIITPVQNQQMFQERNEWLSGESDWYTNSGTSMTSNIYSYTPEHIDLLLSDYASLVTLLDRQISIITLDGNTLFFSTEVLKKILSYLPRNILALVPENEARKQNLTFEICTPHDSLISEDGQVYFNYHQIFCKSCPTYVEGLLFLDWINLPNFTSFTSLEILLPDFLEQYQDQLSMASTPEDIINTVAAFTKLFIIAHPFYDGNGRTFRLLAGYVLMLYGLAPPVFNSFSPLPCSDTDWRNIFSESQWYGQIRFSNN